MELLSNDKFSAETVCLGPLNTNVGIISNRLTGEAIVIDVPPNAAESVSSMLASKKLRVIYVLITHGHWDHCGEAALLQQKGAMVFAHSGDSSWIEEPSTMSFFSSPDITLLSCKIDKYVDDIKEIELCDLNITIEYIPGHSNGSVGYFFEDLGIAFTGDVLFNGTVGRSDLPGGDKHRLFKSIRERIYSHKKDIIIVPGHGWTTTIGHEMANNPYVRSK
ncbi:MAG: MBL fold metallo-hydrolase [Puniceicoccales bacterium]|jgi:glyoxylase-like metal-dependent hydrolase (beta-lactamase superfamily II)|nr:MBL fold metallo-hydrolase [Puniceicoccales bacterium]